MTVAQVMATSPLAIKKIHHLSSVGGLDATLMRPTALQPPCLASPAPLHLPTQACACCHPQRRWNCCRAACASLTMRAMCCRTRRTWASSSSRYGDLGPDLAARSDPSRPRAARRGRLGEPQHLGRQRVCRGHLALPRAAGNQPPAGPPPGLAHRPACCATPARRTSWSSWRCVPAALQKRAIGLAHADRGAKAGLPVRSQNFLMAVRKDGPASRTQLQLASKLNPGLVDRYQVGRAARRPSLSRLVQ